MFEKLEQEIFGRFAWKFQYEQLIIKIFSY